MSEPSEETANAVPAVPPQENPPPDPNYSFYLKMKPLRTLKLAIEALADPSFNNDGFGMVGAEIVENNEGFAISVTNNSNAIATLWLKGPGMIRFDIYAPMVMKLVPLDLISQAFPRNLDGDDDTVAVFHVQESNQLCFEFGTTPPTRFWAKIVEIEAPVTLFPDFAISSGTIVPVNGMKEMIDYVLQSQSLANKIVSVQWEKGFATFEIGSGKKWEYDYSHNNVVQPMGLTEGQIFRESFNWSYTELMKKASLLADMFGVHFLTYPKKYIMFQFKMGELGDLVFIKKALLVVPDSQQRTHTHQTKMPSE